MTDIHFNDLNIAQTDLLGLRNQASLRLKAMLTEIHASAEATLQSNGQGTACAMQLAQAEDDIIRALFDLACRAVGATPPLSIIAVGGYGRGTLAPGSDIDLMFLVPDGMRALSEKIIEFILYALWDARQKVGHATRTADECLALVKSDNTIMTAVLEARFICGQQTLFDDLIARFRKGVVQKSAKQFVVDKLAERDLRHAKYGESRYSVEPDIKDGKGGLRDLHTLFWIAKFLFNAQSTEELAEKGVFSAAELARFRKCEDFLWAVRCHLHFLSKRGEDKLSFDRQSELAQRLGYKAHGGLKHVERFMKHYFLIAKDVGNLTRIFCASLEAKHLKDAPTLSGMIGKFLPKGKKNAALPSDFTLEAGRVAFKTDDSLRRDPVNIIRIFKVSGSLGCEIHPDALHDIRLNLRLIDEALRKNTEANILFVQCLTDVGDPETVLRAMNESGVLGRLLPEFGKIVAMMQFNMYHHFTVDEHLIRTVGVLRGIESGALAEEHPLAAQIFPTLTSRRALFVAGLLHDIAKGRDEDHSLAGERLARDICPRLGLSAADTETVAWLIRHHLLMSETAQMRDLNDFKTILDFSAVVQSPERLKLLVILTVADIRAVGPGVWNGWKGQLLRTLYAETEPVLTGGHTSVTRKARIAEAQDLLLSKSALKTEAQKQALLQRHYDAYWLNVPVEQQLRHETLIARAAPRDVTTDVRSDAFAAVTEITIYSPDHPRLLATITGACAAANANIIGAQIFTTTDGMALDTILLSREFADEADEKRRALRVADTISKALRGQLRLKDALAAARKPEYRVQSFQVEPRVIIDNTSSNKHTIIEVNGLDRVGLLHHLTDALFQLNLNIASAHITTFGEKVIDVFYVTDLTGAKITSESRQQRITDNLMQVLTPIT
jgi:[protein-PII] uridylyltransferase